jgi:hypothetical protein
MSAPPRLHSPCAPEGRLPRCSRKHRSRTHPCRRTQPCVSPQPGVGTTASLPQAGAHHRDDDCATLDDKQPSVSAPDGRLLAAKSARVRLPNTSPNFQARALRNSKFKFEYRTSTGYGSSASCTSLPGSGSSPVVVEAAIASGLAANTTYHFRISATNSAGTTKGTDLTFKTS